jgi:hypothetical protein
MADRYTRVVLTVIAACLVYLCLVFSGVGTLVRAQEPAPQGAQRPGMLTGPAEVVIVGWRGAEAGMPVSVRNVVTTTPAADGAQRILIAGWEDPKQGVKRLTQDGGLPVDASAATRPSRVVIAGTEVSSPFMWRQRLPVEVERTAPAK